MLEPLDETFPAVGEVAILKRIGDGRIRVRSRHLYKNQPVTEELDEIQLAKLRIVPDTDKPRPPGKLNDSIWRRHVREKYVAPIATVSVNLCEGSGRTTIKDS